MKSTWSIRIARTVACAVAAIAAIGALALGSTGPSNAQHVAGYDTSPGGIVRR